MFVLYFIFYNFFWPAHELKNIINIRKGLVSFSLRSIVSRKWYSSRCELGIEIEIGEFESRNSKFRRPTCDAFECVQSSQRRARFLAVNETESSGQSHMGWPTNGKERESKKEREQLLAVEHARGRVRTDDHNLTARASFVKAFIARVCT